MAEVLLIYFIFAHWRQSFISCHAGSVSNTMSQHCLTLLKHYSLSVHLTRAVVYGVFSFSAPPHLNTVVWHDNKSSVMTHQIFVSYLLITGMVIMIILFCDYDEHVWLIMVRKHVFIVAWSCGWVNSSCVYNSHCECNANAKALVMSSTCMLSVCVWNKVSLTCSNGVFGDTFTVCLLPFGVKTDTAAPLAAMTPWRHRCLFDKTLCVSSAPTWRHSPSIFFLFAIYVLKHLIG